MTGAASALDTKDSFTLKHAARHASEEGVLVF